MTTDELKRMNKAMKIIGYAMGIMEGVAYQVKDTKLNFILRESITEIDTKADEIMNEIMK